MRGVACAFVGMLLLSGCVVARVDLAVDAQGTVDGTAAIAYRIGFLDASGTSAADAQDALLADLSDDGVDGLTCVRFRDEETIGATCTLINVPVAQLSQFDVFDRRVAIARVDDRIVVDSVIDLTEFAPDPANPLDAVLRVSFAGPIIEQSGGSVEGTAVTGTPRLGERLEARAVAVTALLESHEPVPLPIVAVLGVVVAASVTMGVYLLVRRR
jgi:hypothetical protein